MRESLDRRASRSSTCSHSTQRGSADVASLHSQQGSLDNSNHSHQASPVLESSGSFSSGDEPSNPWARRAEHRRRSLQVQHRPRVCRCWPALVPNVHTMHCVRCLHLDSRR